MIASDKELHFVLKVYLLICGHIGSYFENIQSASHKHYFRDFFRVQISSEEQPVCSILLPGLLNISECHLVIMLNFYGVLYIPTPIFGCTP